MNRSRYSATIRPRSWIARHKIVAGQHIPLNIEELQVHGSAFVTAVDDCPEIARGEGSVVTARFITREVNSIVRAEIVGPDGEIEVIEGTPIHPIWSVDRNDWVPLGNLVEGETLQASEGIAKVSSLSLVTCSLPVYNVEVHGEHVYQVGVLGVLVQNTCVDDVLNETASAVENITSKFKLSGDEALEGALKWLQDGYREIGKPSSGVFLSKDGLRRFRMDPNSLLGNHPPFVPHVHFEWLSQVVQILHLHYKTSCFPWENGGFETTLATHRTTHQGARQRTRRRSTCRHG